MLLQLPLKVGLLARRLLYETSPQPSPHSVPSRRRSRVNNLQHALTNYLNGVTISNGAGSARARARLHYQRFWDEALRGPQGRRVKNDIAPTRKIFGRQGGGREVRRLAVAGRLREDRGLAREEVALRLRQIPIHRSLLPHLVRNDPADNLLRQELRVLVVVLHEDGLEHDHGLLHLLRLRFSLPISIGSLPSFLVISFFLGAMGAAPFRHDDSVR
jgi:hypothetical protein